MSKQPLELTAIIERKDLRDMFGKEDDKGQPLIGEVLTLIETAVNGIVYDINTKDGQKTCRSLAAKVGKAKVAIENEGKAVKEEYTKVTALIDSDRRLSKDRMQALQDKVRKPLTELEAAEALRIETHNKNLESINPDNLVIYGLSSIELKEMLARVEAFEISDDWQEFKLRAANYKERTVNILNDAIGKAEVAEAEKAELEQLRAESAERAKRDREEALIKKAKEEAKAEAEAEAKAKEEKAAADAQAEIDKAKAEAEAYSSKANAEAQAKIDESNERERQANEREAAARAEAAKAQQEAAEAIERAETAAAEQKKQESIRLASEKQKAQAEVAQKKADAKRQANKKYIDGILTKAAADLEQLGLSQDDSIIAIKAIYEGKVTNTMISI